MSNKGLERPHLRPCTECGMLFRVRPYSDDGICSSCVKWAVIARDMRIAYGDAPTDYDDWEAAV